MRKILAFLLSIALTAFLFGCDATGTGDEAAQASSANKFRILAGSELKDVAGLVTDFGKSQGVDVVFEYTGTLTAVDRLSERHSFDDVWVSHGKYLQMVPEVKSQIKSSEKTMYSRVVLGVKPEVVKALGWKSGKTGWTDVVKAAKAGKFHFAMTNPTGSNTGFVALAGLAAELSGKGDALEEADIPSDKLKELFAGQSLTSGSSGALAELVLADASKVDGMVNYESVIRTMSDKGVPLEVIIPREGVITADYPLMNLANSKNADFHSKLVAFLRSAETQKRIAETTHRTPLTGSGSDEIINELPFPGKLNVVEAILRGFLNEYSKPASTYFGLDVSGSMDGERIEQLKASLDGLATTSGMGSDRFAAFKAREHIRLMPFSTVPFSPSDFNLGESSKNSEQNAAELRRLANYVSSLRADGGTAIFDTVSKLYPDAQEELRHGGRTVSIVLLTDGMNNNGMSLNDFMAFVQYRGEPKVPVFAILYGDANYKEMQALAGATGGRVFDAKRTPLSRVMKEIRTYQ